MAWGPRFWALWGDSGPRGGVFEGILDPTKYSKTYIFIGAQTAPTSGRAPASALLPRVAQPRDADPAPAERSRTGAPGPAGTAPQTLSKHRLSRFLGFFALVCLRSRGPPGGPRRPRGPRRLIRGCTLGGNFKCFKGRKSVILGVWAAPGAPETLPKGGGHQRYKPVLGTETVPGRGRRPRKFAR